MSREKKMITSEEFDIAVQLIADYKLQLDRQLKDVLVRNQKIDIQGSIKENTFRMLQRYYQLYYGVRLQWEDLKTIDPHLLEAIDYDKIKLLKECGCMSLFNLKKLMISYSALDREQL
jgi:hypothetical protein